VSKSEVDNKPLGAESRTYGTIFGRNLDPGLIRVLVKD